MKRVILVTLLLLLLVGVIYRYRPMASNLVIPIKYTGGSAGGGEPSRQAAADEYIRTECPTIESDTTSVEFINFKTTVDLIGMSYINIWPLELHPDRIYVLPFWAQTASNTDIRGAWFKYVNAKCPQLFSLDEQVAYANWLYDPNLVTLDNVQEWAKSAGNNGIFSSAPALSVADTSTEPWKSIAINPITNQPTTRAEAMLLVGPASMIVYPDEQELYNFSKHTFTSAGATGPNGPTLKQISAAYGSIKQNITVQDGIQKWTVPRTGMYIFDVKGAEGGGGITNGIAAGRSRRLRGVLPLFKGEIINILVGQSGTYCGGGGGTFIVRDNGQVPLIIAAGGNGAGSQQTTIVGIEEHMDGAQIRNVPKFISDALYNAGVVDSDAVGSLSTRFSFNSLPFILPPSGIEDRNGGGFTYSGQRGQSPGKSYLDGGVGGDGGGFGGGGGAISCSGYRTGGGGGYIGGTDIGQTVLRIYPEVFRYNPIPASSFLDGSVIRPDDSLVDSGVGFATFTLCARGYYIDATTYRCSRCVSGSYCPENATGVFRCPVGNYCPTTASRLPCTVGNFCPTPGLVEPTACPGGYYCPSSGLTAATLTCTVGNFCPVGSTGLTTCPAGSYCPTVGLAAATTCPAGSYCPSSGLTAATTCPAGSYCPTVGLTAATTCPAGSYCPTVGLTAATTCPAGSYCPSSGLTAATTCPAGSYCPVGSVNPLVLPGTYIGAALIDGLGSDSATSVACDSKGNIYIAGYYGSSYGSSAASISSFSSTPTLGTAGTLPTVGQQAGFVAKWNSDGVYVGAAFINGSNSERAFGVVCDSRDNVYITGFYGPSGASISNFALQAVATLPATSGTSSGFVARWNAGGTFMSAAVITSSTAAGVSSTSIACDSRDNVYITGYYDYSAASISSFSSSPTAGTAGTLPATAGSSSGFVAKWDSAGVYVGAAVIDGRGIDRAFGVACDSGDNVYIAGVIYGSHGANISNFAPSPTSASPPGTLPVEAGVNFTLGFVAKWDSGGLYVGAAVIDGRGSDSTTSVACDSNGNIYVTGIHGTSAASISSFSSSPTIVGAPGTLPNAIGYIGGFVAKWNSAGVYMGAAVIDGLASERALGVVCDSGDNVYISGYYGSSSSGASISNFALQAVATLPATSGTSSGFVARWNAGGTFMSAAVITSSAAGTSVACDSNGNVYISGYYGSSAASISSFSSSPTIVGAPGTLPVTAGGSYSGFVAKWTGAPV